MCNKWLASCSQLLTFSFCVSEKILHSEQAPSAGVAWRRKNHPERLFPLGLPSLAHRQGCAAREACRGSGYEASCRFEKLLWDVWLFEGAIDQNGASVRARESGHFQMWTSVGVVLLMKSKVRLVRCRLRNFRYDYE